MSEQTKKISEPAEGHPNAVPVRLKWGSTKDLVTIYVNHMTITHAGTEFYLTFGELPVPAFMNAKDVPEELEITPKVRLAISPEAMKAIARVIQENLESFMRKESK